MTFDEVRDALDKALREAEAEDPRDGHVWGDSLDCRSHNEGLHCCLDSGHDNYDRMVDDLAARIAKRLP